MLGDNEVELFEKDKGWEEWPYWSGPISPSLTLTIVKGKASISKLVTMRIVFHWSSQLHPQTASDFFIRTSGMRYLNRCGGEVIAKGTTFLFLPPTLPKI